MFQIQQSTLCVVTNNADNTTHTVRKSIQVIVQSRLYSIAIVLLCTVHMYV